MMKYKTKGNTNPQGKPRVYFCCHRDDFDKLFSPVTDEILNIQKNVVIWYRDPSMPVVENDVFFSNLSQMQLFVIPVTARFLYKDNPARTIEMAYAVNNHIPVLPLMQEPGLDNDFNRICGNMQFLDKNASSADLTALSYEEKLKKFLEAVLVSDEQAARIREAFDAYIFLSYRKKDRAEAQKIMHLIHRNDFCRDIAIWYDEFLTPGEDFNKEIEAAMKKSSLFALVVTPSLLEDQNYVQTNEYPASIKMGKARIPIEAKDTDSTILQKMYEGIGDCYQITDPETIAVRLRELLWDIALKENKDDPAHNFLIGLAYLTGIDVEVDHNRAVELITSAANADLPEAYEKLVVMYRTGEGVERNYHTSTEWQEKYVVYLKKDAKEKNIVPAIEKLFWELCNLGDYHTELHRLEDARRVYESMLECAKELKRREPSRVKRGLLLSYGKLGDICVSEGNLSEAREFYEKGLEIIVALAEETGTIEARRDLFTSYGKLGDICVSEGRLAEAREFYEKGLVISAALAEETGTIEARLNLSISYIDIGDICVSGGRLAEAKEWYEKGLEIRTAIAVETGTVQAKRRLSVSYNRLGDFCMSECRLAEAKEWYEKGLEVRSTLAEEIGTIEARRDLSISYGRLGDICMSEGRLAEAREFYEKELVKNAALAEETGTIEARRDLSISYGRLGDICMSEGRLAEAREFYEKELVISAALAEETGTIEARRDLSISYDRLGDICKSEGRLSEAREFYEKGLVIRAALAEETGTIEARRDLSISYDKLGDICMSEGKQNEAKDLYKKGLIISAALAEETGTIEARRDLSVSYDRLGDICKSEGRLSEAREFYEKGLVIRAALAEETGTIEARRHLFLSYERLGDVCGFQGRLNEAKRCFEKGLEISTVLAEETGTIEARCNLSFSYIGLGDVYRFEGKLNEAKDLYKKGLGVSVTLYDESTSLQALENTIFTLYDRLVRVCELLGDIKETEKWMEERDSIKKG